MAQATNYQCPSCGGPLRFSGTSQNLECDYCGSSWTVEKINSLKEEKIHEEAKTFSDAETANLREYNCPSCGAQLFCDETTAATSCPY